MQIAEDSMFQSRMLEVLRTYPCRLQDSPAELLPHLFLGNYMDARNTRRLRDLGITHVMNCASVRSEVVNPYPEGSGVVGYLSFTADDADDYDMVQHFEDARNFIDDAYASGGRVLVHCAQGINRSGFIVVAYLMVSQRLDVIEATEYVKTHRGLLLTNKSFQKQLIQFARDNDLLHPDPNPKAEFSIPL